MKRNVLFLIFLFFGCYVSAQDKSITINTGQSGIKESEITVCGQLAINLSQSIINALYGPHDMQCRFLILDKKKGIIQIAYFHDDTIGVKYQGNIPIVICGLSKVKDDVITISGIPSIVYVPIDSLRKVFVKYYNKDSIDMGYNKEKIEVFNNSLKAIPGNNTININGRVYTLSLETKERDETTWYCTPGKRALSEHIKGVYKYFVVKL